MCCCCGGGWGRMWTGLTVLWALVYVCAGAVQIVTGIFLLISLPDHKLCSNIWAGTWNVLAGIGGGMIACFGAPSPRRQRRLLTVAVSILAVNTVNAVITEWVFYMAGDALIIPSGFLSTEPQDTEESEVVLSGTDKHVKSLVANARVTAGIAAAIILIASFLDSQFTFCSIDSTKNSRHSKSGKARGSHEQVSDIEYIIPRPKSNSEPKPTNSAYNAYAQSWVFESETANNTNHAPSPYLKLNADAEALLVNGKEHVSPLNSSLTDITMPKEETIIIANPVVHIEEASDESNSNSDRKLCYMKSFSRTPSPVVLSAASSQASLNNPPIYECLEKLTEPTVYRSRLNTALSVKDEPQYASTSPRKELQSPRTADPMQYASLMVELEQALSKKEKNSVSNVMSPQSDTESSRQESSKSESQKTDFKSSDAEFSKELEAALQLIQDLESPNTAETPSEGPRPLAVWHSGQHSDSEKTLSAVGSLAELTSPLTECLPIPVPHQIGKRDCGVVVQCHSQSTSGYSSPTRKLTPNWSTASSMDGSSSDLGRTLSFQIRNNNNSAVISLFPGPPCEQTSFNNISTLPAKSVTVVRINGNDLDVQNNNIPDKIDNRLSTTLYERYEPKNSIVKRSASMSTWNVMSLLRKKKQIPRLPPDLESAIIKSESLAHLTEKELLQRHERNKEIQRQIEQRVQQQLGQMTESNC